MPQFRTTRQACPAEPEQDRGADLTHPTFSALVQASRPFV